MGLVEWPTRGREIERMSKGTGKTFVVPENVWGKNEHDTDELLYAVNQEIPLEEAERAGLVKKSVRTEPANAAGDAENKKQEPPAPRKSAARKRTAAKRAPRKQAAPKQ